MFEQSFTTRSGQASVLRVPEQARYVQVGSSDVMLPRQFEVVLWPDDTEKQPVHIATFAMIEGRPVCIGAGAQMVVPEDREVQTADLRAVRIQDMLEHAVDYLAAKQTPPDPGGWMMGPDLSGGAARAVHQSRRRVGDDVLRKVAAVYEAHLDAKPTAAVSDHFDIPLRTASNWVKRATEQGFIKERQRKGDS
jgi:hypothetical protein